MERRYTSTQVTTECHFMVPFFSMKCECVVSGHCARIELSLVLPVGLIGLLVMMKTTTMETIWIVTMGLVVVMMVGMAVVVVTVTVTMAMVERVVGVGVAGMVGKSVMAMVSKVVAMAAIIRPAAAVFVPVLRSLAPVHLERCSFQATH